ncbi:YgaP family membrane protein [Ferruginibacter sp. SUN106]|uniref:YgaP family membrane protein n=1 Tax=Ferruginibacter sp. SUN106 TaxID=2978348 RepID=UPI003D36E6E2
MRERIVRAVAGAFVLISITLSHYVNSNWIWLAVFVGVNLLQSAFTKFCPLEIILNKAGVKK